MTFAFRLRHSAKSWLQIMYPVRHLVQQKKMSVYSMQSLKPTPGIYHNNVIYKYFTRQCSTNSTSSDNTQISVDSSNKLIERQVHETELNELEIEENKNIPIVVGEIQQENPETDFPLLGKDKICDKNENAEIYSDLENETAIDSSSKELLSPGESLSSVEHLTELLPDISNLHKTLPTRAESLAPYVNHSIVLQNLITLGVDLSKVSNKYTDVANLLLRMDFDTEVKPYLMFLYDNGVQHSDLGLVINRNPCIFTEDIDDLQVRVNFLESKRFSQDDIARILTITPRLLSMPTIDTDYQLGFIQQEFKLTNAQVRKAVTQYPKLILCNRSELTVKRVIIMKTLGFTAWELKGMFLKSPKIITTGTSVLVERFDYLHNMMGISHEVIKEWPNVLHTRVFIMKERHEFLKMIRRDQYDPKKNFVHLKRLVSHSNDVFCDEVAKVPLEQYNQYLKTL